MRIKCENAIFLREFVAQHVLDDTVTITHTIKKGTHAYIILGGDEGVYFRAECVADINDTEYVGYSITNRPLMCDFYATWEALDGRLVNVKDFLKHHDKDASNQ